MAARSIHSLDTLTVELLELINLNTLTLKTYKLYQLLQEHGIQELRLPSYHCDFNTIEYIWSDMKSEIRHMNPTGDMNMIKLFRETEAAINKISINRWQPHCNHVQNLEIKYWDKDRYIEEMRESLKISLTVTDESNTDYGINPFATSVLYSIFNLLPPVFQNRNFRLIESQKCCH